jgi:hypothetical protein
MEKEYVVRLDESKLPSGDNHKHALSIAGSLIYICGVIKVWDEPKHGRRMFFVREIPQDVPQAGVHWIVEDLPQAHSNPWFENE